MTAADQDDMDLGYEERLQNVSLVDCRKIVERLGISRSTLERMVQRDEFPRSFRVSPKRKAWRLKDVEARVQAQHLKAGCSEQPYGEATEDEKFTVASEESIEVTLGG